jgi:VIT1/CCC1 family predicted Fe2+/Mn2+ transporter
VSSQRDTERSDVAKERAEIRRDPAGETRELAGIYRSRGLARPLGIAGARAGGAGLAHAALRVGIGGSAAMAVTALVGRIFGAATG